MNKDLKNHQDQMDFHSGEIKLLEEEKLELLKSDPLGSAEAAALTIGIHPTQGGYSNKGLAAQILRATHPNNY